MDPRWCGHRGLDLELHVNEGPVPLACNEVERRRLDHRAGEGHRPGPEWLDAPEAERPGAEHRRSTFRAHGRPCLPVLPQAERSAVGEGDVRLEPVGVPARGDRLDPDSGQAHLAAVVEDPEAHRVAHLGVVRAFDEDVLVLGVHAAGEVNAHAGTSRSMGGPVLGAHDVFGEQRPDLGEIQPEGLWGRVRTGLSVLPVLRPPPAHRGLELFGDRFVQPAIEPAHLADGIGLHGAEADVVEAVTSAAVAELQRPVHADRPMLDVELAQIVTVEVVSEDAGDVRVDVGHGEDHVGRVAMRHDEPSVGKGTVQVIEEEDVHR